MTTMAGVHARSDEVRLQRTWAQWASIVLIPLLAVAVAMAVVALILRPDSTAAFFNAPRWARVTLTDEALVAKGFTTRAIR